jgi:serine/threonine-protein kinase
LVGETSERRLVEIEQLKAALSHHLAGRYELDPSELGAGGMAVVFGARDLRHHRRVAVKLMRPDQAVIFGASRFLREINLTAGLQHPHILPLLDSGSVSFGGVEIPFYVMPLVAGQSLRTRLDVDGQLELREALAIARDVAEGLQYAHDRGVVHRDIKPENILLNESGAALIADFGVARATGADQPSHLTETGTTVGTPTYMSPEQLSGSAPTEARSDQYSLAATVYEMLAGRPPYEAPSRDALITRRLAGPPEPLGTVRPDLPAAIAEVVSRGMATTTDERFPSVRELLDALTAAVGGSLTAGAPVRRGRRPLLAAFVVVAVGAVAVWTWRRPVRTLTGGAMVVLADIENLTSDSTLGPALRVAATVGLQQSSSFSVYPRSRLRSSLKRMGRTISDTVLSEAVAREIAYRESGRAVIVLNVAEVGGRYTVSCRVVDPIDGSDLAADRVSVERLDQLLNGVDRLVGWTRRVLGDTKWSSATPLPLVTTSSLPALRAFANARLALSRSDWSNVAAALNQAIELDSGFAMARALMGQYHIFSNRVPEGLKWLRDANERTSRLSEPEQLNVKSLLARAEGRHDDELGYARALAMGYPSMGNLQNYGEALRGAQRLPEAIAAFERARDLDTADAGPYLNLAIAHKSTGNYRLALDYYSQVDRLDSTLLLVDFQNQQWGGAYVAVGDYAGAETVFRRMVARPTRNDQARGHRSLAYLALYQGQYGEAVASLRRSIPLQVPGSLSEYRDQIVLADAEATRGNQTGAQAALDRVFAIFKTAQIQAAAVMFGGHQFVRAGQLGRAQLLLDSLVARAALRPLSSQDQGALTLLKADVALAEGRLQEARATLTRFRNDEYEALGLSLEADVFAALGHLDSAVAKAKSAVEHKMFGLETQQDWLRSFTQLARLAEATGDSATARAAYSSLIEQWKEGDRDLPPLVAARRELARLQAASQR